MLRWVLLAILTVGFAVPGLAQPAKIFLASTGLDTNDGGRTTPKRSLQAAHDAVAAGGSIVILDTAGYGPVRISKSLAVTVPPGVSGFVTAVSGNGVTVAAGIDDVIALSGLIIEGPGSGNGIYVTSAASVVVDNCVVRNFGEGIFVNTPFHHHLTVRNSAVRNTNYAIDIEASGISRNASATVVDTVLTDNATGLYASASPGTGTSTAFLVATRCSVSRSSIQAAVAFRGGTIVLDQCTISRNVLAFRPNGSGNGGVILSRGNNTVFDNDTTGPAPASQPGF